MQPPGRPRETLRAPIRPRQRPGPEIDILRKVAIMIRRYYANPTPPDQPIARPAHPRDQAEARIGELLEELLRAGSSRSPDRVRLLAARLGRAGYRFSPIGGHR